MKNSLVSLELSAVVNELQLATNGKLSQIYHQEKGEFLFQLHVKEEGKLLLKIIPGKLLCLTKNKDVPLKPSSFCMQLRKYISNASINKLYQKDAERIVVFELEKKEKFFLIIELFSKGNLILTDEKYNTITVLERQNWKDRSVKPGEKYQFPKPLGENWKELNENKLQKMLNKSVKNTLVVALAKDAGLGGLYAEEICKLASVDKGKVPKEVEDKEIKAIIKEIKQLLKKIESPQGFIYAEEITPFQLSEQKAEIVTKTYNEAVDTLNPLQIVSPYEKKINSLQMRVKIQENAISKQEQKIDENTKKGELIYEKYQPLQKMLDIVKELKKSKDWKDIEKELEKEKNIKQVDLKNKKIIVELEKKKN